MSVKKLHLADAKKKLVELQAAVKKAEEDLVDEFLAEVLVLCKEYGCALHAEETEGANGAYLDVLDITYLGTAVYR